MNVQSTLGTLTQMLRKYRAHESATRVGVEYMDVVKLDDHFRKGMFVWSQEKKLQFGAGDSNEEGDTEDSTLIPVELELEDMGCM